MVTLLATLPVATVAYPWWRHKLIHIVGRWSDHLLVVLNTLAATAIGGADVWIVGNHFGSADTAAYAFSVTMVASLALVSAALSGGLAPRLAGLLAAGEIQEAQRLSVRFVRWGTLIAVAGYGVLVLVVEPVVVHLGGPSYAGVTSLIAILGLVKILQSILSFHAGSRLSPRRINSPSTSRPPCDTRQRGTALLLRLHYSRPDPRKRRRWHDENSAAKPAMVLIQINSATNTQPARRVTRVDPPKRPHLI